MTKNSSEKRPWEGIWEIIDSNIGSGGQGKVSIVRNQSTDRNGALKVLKSPKDMERRSRMYREIATLISLEGTGANIPMVLDHNTDQWRNINKVLYSVMDYIPGPTLYERINEQGPFSLEEANIFMASLITSISRCHESGIIHRDIKPDNIILKDNAIDSPFIIDFGLTFNEGSEHDHKTKTDQQLGNRFLLLPELTTPSDNPENKRQLVSDVTQLVGILFYLLTGESPMTLHDEKGRMPHQRKEYAYKQTSVGEGLDLLFTAGFTYEAMKRIQTCSSLLQWIERALNQELIPNNSAIFALNKFRERNLEPSIAKERWQRATCDQILKAVISEFSKFVLNETGGIFVASPSGQYVGGFEEIPGKYHYGVNIHEPNQHTVNFRIHWIGDYDHDVFIISTKDMMGRETIGVQTIGNEMLIVEDAKRRFDILLARAINHLT